VSAVKNNINNKIAQEAIIIWMPAIRVIPISISADDRMIEKASE